MIKVISANLNGIRSAASKGFFEWLESEHADFVCVQELKAQAADLKDRLSAPRGFQSYFHFAKKKGYSGTAVLTKKTPQAVQTGFGVAEFDEEGRYTELQYPGLSIISVYFPSGSASAERQASKFRFLEVFLPHLQGLRQSGREIILCGDVNIAHTERDLKNAKGNLKNSGFLPEERQWMTDLLGEGWVDVYRRLHPEATGEAYTWWSNRGQAYAKNVGWRIDYQLATEAMAKRARRAGVYKTHRFSDHAPLIIEYEEA